jgi:hypothetical protein
MEGIYITRVELDALYGLPHLAQVLYFVLRQRMDLSTGKVGSKPLVSWRGLAEWAYQEPHPGMKGGTPSPQQMRRSAVWLVKRGLVRMLSNMAQTHLIFFLPLAHRGKNLSAIKPTGSRQAKPTGSFHRENHGEADRGEEGQADTHQSIRVTTTIPNTTKELRAPVDFIVSPACAADRQKLMDELQRHPHVNGQAQAALDELAGAIEKGAVRGGALPYFRGILRKIADGSFKPALGLAIAHRRAQVQRSAAASTPDSPPASHAQARAAIAAAKKLLKGMP